mmetsp:Transcript_219/g.274  ORF Transcript_219/g.274 Transcript_219/m.274 type:complete len:345 (-) Transcript_219:162-1196(-)
MTAACGEGFAICLSDDGSAWAFGSASEGQLGFDWSVMKTPLIIPNLPPVEFVSCSFSHSVCIDECGDLWVFGRNESGQLGIKSKATCYSPVKLRRFTASVVYVSCGTHHTLCIDSNSKVWSFGSNKSAQLGLGHSEMVTGPQEVQELPCKMVSAASNYSVFVSITDQVQFCGKISNGCTSEVVCSVETPADVIVTSIASGNAHTLILSSDGDVYSMGHNEYGQCGRTIAKQDPQVLKRVEKLPTIGKIYTGQHHSMCIDEDDYLWTFGCTYEHDFIGYEVYSSDFIPRNQGIRVTHCTQGGTNSFLFNDNQTWTYGTTLQEISMPEDFNLLVHRSVNFVKSARK